jgi:branched-chain amino acid transport system substrate-binding protein
MLRRNFLQLASTCATCAVAACASGSYSANGASSPTARTVAILLPLTGNHAELGQPMLQAAQLALSAPDSPRLMSQDTAGTPGGAAAAGRVAIQSGATLILGPLTSSEVAAAAVEARAAKVPVLAFSNDPAVAQPGVWPLGITPDQQVQPLVSASRDDGRTRFAALLPNDGFGHALAAALSQAIASAGLGPPSIRFHGQGMSSINVAVRAVSSYDARWSPIQQEIRLASNEGTVEGRRKANQLRQATPPPPPFDVLLLGDTGGALAEIPPLLAYYFVEPPTVHFIGPTLWGDPHSGSHAFPGAWFAAPDPAARTSFASAYAERYGAPPPPLADLAYDAASIARVMAPRGYSFEAMATLGAFQSVDGPLLLLPDGHVRRGLAVFQIERGGPQMIRPAPTTIAAGA